MPDSPLQESSRLVLNFKIPSATNARRYRGRGARRPGAREGQGRGAASLQADIAKLAKLVERLRTANQKHRRRSSQKGKARDAMKSELNGRVLCDVRVALVALAAGLESRSVRSRLRCRSYSRWSRCCEFTAYRSASTSVQRQYPFRFPFKPRARSAAFQTDLDPSNWTGNTNGYCRWG
jgi:hypothetical protein